MRRIEIPPQNTMIMKQGMKKKIVFPIGVYVKYWSSLSNKHMFLTLLYTVWGKKWPPAFFFCDTLFFKQEFYF